MLNRQVRSLGILVHALGLISSEENNFTGQENHMKNKSSTIVWAIGAMLMLGFGASTITADDQVEMKGEMATKGKVQKSKLDKSSGDSGEESGTQYMLDETYDETRRGAQLVLKYEPEKEAFMGTVANTTKKKLSKVRVEVHLSNGVELGPTTPKDLDPNEKMDVMLAATGQKFKTWGAHPEVGGSGRGEHSGGHGEGEHASDGEHGSGGESKGEHGKRRTESRGEHN